VPVTVGDTIIDSGDIVVLDADGAVSVKQIRLAEVLAKAEARLERETQLRVRLEAGEMSYDIRGLRPVVEKQNLSYK
jgi:4-hydroxy-4-methyl-2-oxoglutarate aldolase